MGRAWAIWLFCKAWAVRWLVWLCKCAKCGLAEKFKKMLSGGFQIILSVSLVYSYFSSVNIQGSVFSFLHEAQHFCIYH
jgi:hypothetical protein